MGYSPDTPASNNLAGHHALKGKTPAMAARLTGHKWTMEELLSAQV
jgi:hypothetical protein